NPAADVRRAEPIAQAVRDAAASLSHDLDGADRSEAREVLVLNRRVTRLAIAYEDQPYGLAACWQCRRTGLYPKS
ncbi:MAG: hypothetical protein MK538_15645, partial [Planctomycetes bacterium]|nr:hypothetical protein [Planctomycetota bacterium]